MRLERVTLHRFRCFWHETLDLAAGASARRFTLHLPARWPWAIGFAAALARLREIPLLA